MIQSLLNNQRKFFHSIFFGDILSLKVSLVGACTRTVILRKLRFKTIALKVLSMWDTISLVSFLLLGSLLSQYIALCVSLCVSQKQFLGHF